MGLRDWIRRRFRSRDENAVPASALARAALTRDKAPQRSLGEYDSTSYPKDVADLLRRREEVASELLAMDVTDPALRRGLVPRLQGLLRIYPHPLVYESLIHVYVAEERWDEAKGVAFAAKERRVECLRSPYPEIRAETEHLAEWTPAEVDRLREERGARA